MRSPTHIELFVIAVMVLQSEFFYLLTDTFLRINKKLLKEHCVFNPRFFCLLGEKLFTDDAGFAKFDCWPVEYTLSAKDNKSHFPKGNGLVSSASMHNKLIYKRPAYSITKSSYTKTKINSLGKCF